jgi:hypothetical protein
MLRLPLLLLGSDLCLHTSSEMSSAADDALTISQPLGTVGRQRGIDIVVARQVIGQIGSASGASMPKGELTPTKLSALAFFGAKGPSQRPRSLPGWGSSLSR